MSDSQPFATIHTTWTQKLAVLPQSREGAPTTANGRLAKVTKHPIELYVLVPQGCHLRISHCAVIVRHDVLGVEVSLAVREA